MVLVASVVLVVGGVRWGMLDVGRGLGGRCTYVCGIAPSTRIERMPLLPR